MKTGIDYISAERERQVNEEGWTKEHDSSHTDGSLALAAASYALSGTRIDDDSILVALWPWDASFWKPTPDDRIKELSKAGALIAAEIDRLLALKSQEA